MNELIDHLQDLVSFDSYTNEYAIDFNNNRHFHIEQLDQEKLVRENELKAVTNPVMFNSGSGATSDGLLSNEIFGITKDERSGIFAYINLEEYFIQPYYYKIWLKIDRNLRGCVYETQNFIIDKNGYLEPDDAGNTGIKFLMNNIDKINFKQTKKDNFLKALMDGKKKGLLFTKKLVIIPPYYRDVSNTGGKIGVGEVNKLYISVMNNVRALASSNDYGLEMAGGIRGRIQDNLLEIYDWFTVGRTSTGEEHTGSGIFKKMGVQRRSVMAKTTDYAARLVLSAPNINVDKQTDLMVDMNYSSIPLSACCVIAYPYMIYQLRQLFTNEFGGKATYSYIDGTKLKNITLDNPMLEFSDDRFDKELSEYIHGYSNRYKPVEIPNKEGKKVHMTFKGYSITEEQYAAGKRESEMFIERDMTWMDIFYMCACAATEDKTVMITRYPVDSYFNQLYTKIHVASTIETEPMVINGVFYKWYPKIRQRDIGKDTSNKFIDTCSIANPYCAMMNADYDGDTVTVKMAYSVEANQELQEYIKSKAQFINLSGTNGRTAGNEAIQAMYNLTLILPGTKLEPVEM